MNKFWVSVNKNAPEKILSLFDSKEKAEGWLNTMVKCGPQAGIDPSCYEIKEAEVRICGKIEEVPDQK